MSFFTDIKEEMETHYQRNLTKSPSTRKYTCNSIRICNNSLNELTGFATVISGIIARIEDIGWLDFSFNDLNNIDDVRFIKYSVLILTDF